jgi:L,D-transpeptidase catalytic domain
MRARASRLFGAALTVAAVCLALVSEPAAAASSEPGARPAVASGTGAPTGVVAQPLHGAAQVSWHAPVIPAGRILVSYVVRVSSGLQVMAPASANVLTVTGLADGWWHAFTVNAVYDNGLRATSLRSARVVTPVLSGWTSRMTGGRTDATLSNAVQVRPAGGWTLQLERRRPGVTRWTPDTKMTTSPRGTATAKLHLRGGSWQWRLAVVGLTDPTVGTSRRLHSAVRPVIASNHACVWGSSDIVSAPRKSGSGKRIVWDKSASQVWLVEKSGTVRCSYPVTDNDEDTPVGAYQIRSKSAMSSSVDDGRYWRLAHMARFYLQPGHRLWIGFHAVPQSPSGQWIQPLSSLGKPGYRSHGCVRQHPTNAANLFAFAPVGTKVVVIA